MTTPRRPARIDVKALPWIALNRILKDLKRSDDVLPLLRSAIKQQARAQVRQRIYGRFAVLRYREEIRSLREGKLPRGMK